MSYFRRYPSYGGFGFGGFGGGWGGGYGRGGLFRPVDSIGDVWRNSAVGSVAGYGAQGINATVGTFFGELTGKVVGLVRGIFHPHHDDYDQQYGGYHGRPNPRGFGSLIGRNSSYVHGGMAGDEDDSFGRFVEQKNLQSQPLDKKIEAYVQNNYAELGVERAERYADQVNTAKGDREALIAIARSVEADVNGGVASQQIVNGYPQAQGGGRPNQRETAFQAAFDKIDGVGFWNRADGRLEQKEIDKFARERPQEFAQIAGVLASKGIHASFDGGYQQPLAYNGSRDKGNSRDNS